MEVRIGIYCCKHQTKRQYMICDIPKINTHDKARVEASGAATSLYGGLTITNVRRSVAN